MVIYHPLYETWRGMIKRCTNKNHTYYYRYGGRGIKVCESWLIDFNRFCIDMGEKPSKDYTLDRINNDGDYEPNNCRWATKEEQECNKVNNKFIEYNGKSQTLYQWSKELNIKKVTLKNRLYLGWTIERTFTTPVRKRGKNKCEV